MAYNDVLRYMQKLPYANFFKVFNNQQQQRPSLLLDVCAAHGSVTVLRDKSTKNERQRNYLVSNDDFLTEVFLFLPHCS